MARAAHLGAPRERKHPAGNVTSGFLKQRVCQANYRVAGRLGRRIGNLLATGFEAESAGQTALPIRGVGNGSLMAEWSPANRNCRVAIRRLTAAGL